MKQDPFKLHLRWSDDDSFTRLCLRGSVVTAPPACEVEQLLTLLSRWSGSPVELVLSADCGSVAWFELWGDATSEVPARHLRVCFVPDGHRRRRGGRDAAR